MALYILIGNFVNRIEGEERMDFCIIGGSLVSGIVRKERMRHYETIQQLVSGIVRKERSVDLDRKEPRIRHYETMQQFVDYFEREERMALYRLIGNSVDLDRKEPRMRHYETKQQLVDWIQREERSVDLDRKEPRMRHYETMQQLVDYFEREERSVDLNRKEPMLVDWIQREERMEDYKILQKIQREQRAILNADSREEKMTVEKQEVYLINRHGTKLLKSSLRLAPFFLPCAGGTGHGRDQPEHQGHSEIYPSTLNVVSNCPSLGEYMQRSFTKCADVCGSYMQDGNCAYHCMRDSSKTKLVEFCAKPKPLFDFCPEYDPVDQTIQKDLSTLCNSTFSRNYYNSSDIYFCDPNNCLQLRESSVRSGATTLTTLMNETTEMNDGDSQGLFVLLFVGLAALTLAIIIGYILQRVFVRLRNFSGRTSKMTKKRKQNGKQYAYTETVITDLM